eukprot:11179743-Lingulodinium_polyedra.AAC.1
MLAMPTHWINLYGKRSGSGRAARAVAGDTPAPAGTPKPRQWYAREDKPDDRAVPAIRRSR